MSSKYYNLKKFNPDEKFNFILVSKIEKIENILYNSYESDCGIGKANYNYIMRFIKSQQKEIEKLKFNNHMVGKWNEYLDKECVSKNKIRDKIEEQRQKYLDIHDEKNSINEIVFESTKVDGAIEVLKELLEEN